MPSLGSHLVEVLQQRRLLLHEELAAGVGGVLLLPEGADVDAGRLGDVDQRCHAPEEGAVHPHQVLRGEAVGLVEDEADLRLAALHLPEEHLQLAAHIQLGGVEDQEDQVGPVDEPLAHLVVGVTCGGGEDMRGGWPSFTMNLVATFSVLHLMTFSAALGDFLLNHSSSCIVLLTCSWIVLPWLLSSYLLRLWLLT